MTKKATPSAPTQTTTTTQTSSNLASRGLLSQYAHATKNATLRTANAKNVER